MSRRRVTYVISLVHKSSVFEWTALGLKDRYDLTFILLNSTGSVLEDFLKHHRIKVIRINYRDSRDFFLASLKLFFHLLFRRPDVLHAHLFDAQLAALPSAWLLRIKKRIYTRHNSNYHHVYHPRGVRFDRMSNFFSTQIISISHSTDTTLLDLEHVSRSKLVKIPHGFDLDSFATVPKERITAIRNKWNITGRPVVGVIARQIEWKGIQYIIPAFIEFIKSNPDACLVLANAGGPYSGEINVLLKDIPLRNVILIPFEEDVAALYHTFDMYVHTPVDSLSEAFGQTYVEALAAGVPSIFTLSGIAAEFIIQDRNAFVTDFRDAGGIYAGMMKINGDVAYRDLLRSGGSASVAVIFDREPSIQSLERLYDA